MSAEDCPSTNADLLFWCFVFLIPTSAAVACFLWRRSALTGLLKRYQRQGIAVKAKVIGKKATTVREFRGSLDAGFFEDYQGIKDYSVRPFYLQIRYDDDDNHDATRQQQRSLEVSKTFYQATSVGDTFEMTRLEGHDHRSSILLGEFRATIDLSRSNASFCLLLNLGAFGVCVLNSCVYYGWPLIFGSEVASFISVWLLLTKFRQDKLTSSILEPPEVNDDAELGRLLDRTGWV